MPITCCEAPRAVQTLEGCPLGSGRLEFCTRPLQMLTLDTHLEIFVFSLIDTPQDLLVLGNPWLITHQPSIDWATSTLTQWGPDCTTHWPPDQFTISSVAVAAALTPQADTPRIGFGFRITFWTFCVDSVLWTWTVPWTILWIYLGMYCNGINFTFAFNLEWTLSLPLNHLLKCLWSYLLS